MNSANTNGTASPDVSRLARAVGLLILLTVSSYTYLGISDTPVSAQATVPEFTNHLVDNANVIPDDAENQVNAELADYQNRSKNQIAILTVKTTDPQSIEDFAVDVGNKWGVGSKDQDNGVLMILAMDDRKGRVEVGYGLQGQLTDIASRDILDQHVFPRLKAGNPGEAVVAGERAIRSALGDTNVEAPVPVGNSNNSEQDNNSLWWLPFLFIAPPIVLGMFGGRKRRANGFGNGGWTYWGGGLGGGGLGGGGFGGGGFGGGGFGGGGGGGFGGGGSSGSW